MYSSVTVLYYSIFCTVLRQNSISASWPHYHYLYSFTLYKRRFSNFYTVQFTRKFIQYEYREYTRIITLNCTRIPAQCIIVRVIYAASYLSIISTIAIAKRIKWANFLSLGSSSGVPALSGSRPTSVSSRLVSSRLPQYSARLSPTVQFSQPLPTLQYSSSSDSSRRTARFVRARACVFSRVLCGAREQLSFTSLETRAHLYCAQSEDPTRPAPCYKRRIQSRVDREDATLSSSRVAQRARAHHSPRTRS